MNLKKLEHTNSHFYSKVECCVLSFILPAELHSSSTVESVSNLFFQFVQNESPSIAVISKFTNCVNLPGTFLSTESVISTMGRDTSSLSLPACGRRGNSSKIGEPKDNPDTRLLQENRKFPVSNAHAVSEVYLNTKSALGPEAATQKRKSRSNNNEPIRFEVLLGKFSVLRYLLHGLFDYTVFACWTGMIGERGDKTKSQYRLSGDVSFKTGLANAFSSNLFCVCVCKDKIVVIFEDEMTKVKSVDNLVQKLQKFFTPHNFFLSPEILIRSSIYSKTINYNSTFIFSDLIQTHPDLFLNCTLLHNKRVVIVNLENFHYSNSNRMLKFHMALTPMNLNSNVMNRIYEIFEKIHVLYDLHAQDARDYYASADFSDISLVARDSYKTKDIIIQLRQDNPDVFSSHIFQNYTKHCQRKSQPMPLKDLTPEEYSSRIMNMDPDVLLEYFKKALRRGTSPLHHGAINTLKFDDIFIKYPEFRYVYNFEMYDGNIFNPREVKSKYYTCLYKNKDGDIKQDYLFPFRKEVKTNSGTIGVVCCRNTVLRQKKTPYKYYYNESGGEEEEEEEGGGEEEGDIDDNDTVTVGEAEDRRQKNTCSDYWLKNQTFFKDLLDTKNISGNRKFSVGNIFSFMNISKKRNLKDFKSKVMANIKPYSMGSLWPPLADIQDWTTNRTIGFHCIRMGFSIEGILRYFLHFNIIDPEEVRSLDIIDNLIELIYERSTSDGISGEDSDQQIGDTSSSSMKSATFTIGGGNYLKSKQDTSVKITVDDYGFVDTYPENLIKKLFNVFCLNNNINVVEIKNMKSPMRKDIVGFPEGVYIKNPLFPTVIYFLNDYKVFEVCINKKYGILFNKNILRTLQKINTAVKQGIVFNFPVSSSQNNQQLRPSH